MSKYSCYFITNFMEISSEISGRGVSSVSSKQAVFLVVPPLSFIELHTRFFSQMPKIYIWHPQEARLVLPNVFAIFIDITELTRIENWIHFNIVWGHCISGQSASLFMCCDNCYVWAIYVKYIGTVAISMASKKAHHSNPIYIEVFWTL